MLCVEVTNQKSDVTESFRTLRAEEIRLLISFVQENVPGKVVLIFSLKGAKSTRKRVAFLLFRDNVILHLVV